MGSVAPWFFAPYQFAPDHYLVMIYPFLAWTGLMMLGYCTGIFFSAKYTSAQRSKILLRLGLAVISLFFILRFVNIYGDPHPWTQQKSSLLTFLSFINVHKYPPSLLYMSVTIGVALILLSLLENIKDRFTNIMVTYGRTAFFYYILHLYLIHIVATIVFFIKAKHTVQEAIASMRTLPLLFVLPGEGFNLKITYVIWASLVIILYPLCKWYDGYKSAHKEKWWLSYL